MQTQQYILGNSTFTYVPEELETLRALPKNINALQAFIDMYDAIAEECRAALIHGSEEVDPALYVIEAIVEARRVLRRQRDVMNQQLKLADVRQCDSCNEWFWLDDCPLDEDGNGYYCAGCRPDDDLPA